MEDVWVVLVDSIDGSSTIIGTYSSLEKAEKAVIYDYSCENDDATSLPMRRKEIRDIAVIYESPYLPKLADKYKYTIERTKIDSYGN